MIAQDNEILTSPTKSLQYYNSDWLVREQCRAREESEARERRAQETEAAKALLEKQNEQLQAELKEKSEQLLATNRENETLLAEIARLKSQLSALCY